MKKLGLKQWKKQKQSELMHGVERASSDGLKFVGARCRKVEICERAYPGSPFLMTCARIMILVSYEEELSSKKFN